jgi:1-acyl-sn-glycerol-3-phosphate acyltransferase
MKRTIFSTPVVNSCLRAVSLLALKLVGWKIVGQLPEHNRYVMIAAPHTSNWDFALMLLVAFIKRMDVHWMGKDALFPKPFKGFVQWMGGIAIDRSQANDTVEQMVAHYNNNDELIVLITPEGTRSKVKQWKTGFYHIAHGAGVPIVLGFVDAPTKTMGFGEAFVTCGDVDADMMKILSFYSDKTGIHADNT